MCSVQVNIDVFLIILCTSKYRVIVSYFAFSGLFYEACLLLQDMGMWVEAASLSSKFLGNYER